MSCGFDTSTWDDQTGMVNMNIHTDAALPDGNYTFTLKGTSSKQSFSSPVTVRVVLAPDFGIESAGQPQWTLPSETASIALHLTANESFRNQLNMSCISDAFEDCASWHPVLNQNQSEVLPLPLQAKPDVVQAPTLFRLRQPQEASPILFPCK